MTVYAQIQNSIVVNAIVADTDFIASLPNQNEYKELIRGGVGWTFDGTNFIAPKPFESWTLDSNYDWQAPTAKPNDGKQYVWFEPNKVWIELV